MYIRRSEDVQDVFWTSYVRSVYVLCVLWCGYVTAITLWKRFTVSIMKATINHSYLEKTKTPTNKYMLKFNNANTKKRCEICSKLTIKTPEWCLTLTEWCLPLLLTLNKFHTFFLCFYCWLWTNKCRLYLFMNIKSRSKIFNYVL